MRIGTWNIAGRWDDRHRAFVETADCDVWLFTEVNERVDPEGYERHLSVGLMAAKRRWAGIYSRRPLEALPDPHIASAAAVIGTTTYCSSILPWRSCGGVPTWPGQLHSEKTAIAVDALLEHLPPSRLVWGGDWNHALSGTEWAGSKGGRQHILDAVEKLGLRVPTAELPHLLAGQLSIDHIAIAADRVVTDAMRLTAEGLSDHDCYVIELPTD